MVKFMEFRDKNGRPILLDCEKIIALQNNFDKKGTCFIAVPAISWIEVSGKAEEIRAKLARVK